MFEDFFLKNSFELLLKKEGTTIIDIAIDGDRTLLGLSWLFAFAEVCGKEFGLKDDSFLENRFNLVFLWFHGFCKNIYI